MDRVSTKAEQLHAAGVTPRLADPVAAWEAAGKAPATKAHGSSPPAGHNGRCKWWRWTQRKTTHTMGEAKRARHADQVGRRLSTDNAGVEDSIMSIDTTTTIVPESSQSD